MKPRVKRKKSRVAKPRTGQAKKTKKTRANTTSSSRKKGPVKKAVSKPRSTGPRRRQAGVAELRKLPLPPEVRRLQSARRRLEHQLTAAVQEIGLLRQYEIRANMLDLELQRRDAQIADLRRQYDARIRELESRLLEAAPATAQGRLI